jgi:hypothetical protein
MWLFEGASCLNIRGWITYKDSVKVFTLQQKKKPSRFNELELEKRRRRKEKKKKRLKVFSEAERKKEKNALAVRVNSEEKIKNKSGKIHGEERGENRKKM